MTETITINDLRQHELVILRRLRKGPLTEFELASEIAEHSGFTHADATDRIVGWLAELQAKGFVWSGQLFNDAGQSIHAAALAKNGRELVG